MIFLGFIGGGFHQTLLLMMKRGEISNSIKIDILLAIVSIFSIISQNLILAFGIFELSENIK